MNSLVYTLTRVNETEEIEIPVVVEYSYNKAHRGHRDSMGVPEEPDEDASIEIESVKTTDGIEIEITEKEISEIEQYYFDKEDDSDDGIDWDSVREDKENRE